MHEYDIDEVRACYDVTAQRYSDLFADELDGKPFDRDVLERFAESADRTRPIIEFGTGSGHIGKYLYDCGLRNLVATDIAEAALAYAAGKYPMLRFERRDMLASGYADGSVGGIVCFFGIVHFTYTEIARALAEWKRILAKGGRALFAFHVGNDESLSIDGFLDNPSARATWNFFDADKVIALLAANGTPYSEAIVRYPYPDAEHPTKRGYLQFVKR